MKEYALANAIAGVTAIYYVLCAIWVSVAPNSFTFVLRTWFHGVDIGQFGVRIGIGGLIFGFITLTLAAWVFGYAIAWVYNKSK